MDYGQFREYFRENFYYFLVAQIVLGLIFGSIPLLAAIKKKRRNLGLIAFATAVLIATVSPLLCVIVSVVFTVVIIRKRDADN